MHAVDIVILVCWAAFWIYWFAASVGVKTGRSPGTPFVGIRVGILILVILLARTRIIGAHTNTSNPWLQGIGLALFFGGLALAIWARRYLGRNWGMPMSRKDDPELVTGGPYHSIRHPIYSGILVAMIGTTVAVSVYWLLVVILFGGYFIYSAFTEERIMTGLFPDAYPEYKRSTKMLVPFIF
jgi:protein-S-isoprenylcysteine O-methyltransferase Ste14